jgi:hypothetical protein
MYRRGDMNRLDENSPALAVSPASSPHLGSAHRLIVLVPDLEVDTAPAARKIWELATMLKSRVQFLGLCKDAAHESRLRRQLVTLSAMVKDGNISVESKIEFGGDWLNLIKLELHEGDVIACFAGQHDGLLQRPLRQILESNLHMPIHVLSGVDVQKRNHPDWLLQLSAWTGSLGIIVGSAWLQFRIASLSSGLAQTILLIILIAVEAWLIWAWNSLFG